jgi:hypothetical protein
MPNRWVEHVRAFAAKNNMSYMCAITDPDIKKGYIPTERKKQKTEKLEQAMPSTEPKPKNIVIKPRPKVVIATFETIRYGGIEYAITDDGEMLQLTKKSFKVEDMTKDTGFYIGKGYNKEDRIEAAYSWLNRKYNNDLQKVRHTDNLLKYTKEDAKKLNEKGLAMAIPSQKVLKSFYDPAFLRKKDAVLPDFVTNA